MEVSKPLLRGHSHQAMFFIALGACTILFTQCQNWEERFSIIAYSLSTLALFGISALYHRVNWKVKTKAVMRRLDHSAIYISMVGTGTPICLLAMDSEAGLKLWVMLSIISTLGVLKSICFSNIPNFVRASLYVIAGSMSILFIRELISGLGATSFILLLGGGISYIAGAIIYGLKWPKLNPNIFGYHEVFHVFVNIGALCHFLVIYNLIF
ncbi:MAG: hypothetical protein HON90_08070 [Halobacteriovoraceae bacterium]|jgi:hemolysin III|nr:hypothetical protein [Halobacteriovoraceae bacterium]